MTRKEQIIEALISSLNETMRGRSLREWIETDGSDAILALPLDVPGDDEINLRKLQQEQKEWSERNFPTQNTPYRPLLGIMEEVGELSHAHLKAEQGIRINEDHQAAKFDAIGDIVIYLSDYCNKNGFDLQHCISKTWDQVKHRDWTKNKINGKE